ncbi:hypothetical protein IHQ71_26670 [Rhizobium sp. TH2]|uniref:hypothetical protein n=1 Tax=Rhizobium sp. TH2 TaxID=2775403 RepID=UPI002157122C|nr:hypothetical protein [Rhizobium sp. TH2]UVC08670.1 hypothetical protein IHQ71_26670 [Rhizobium sp. TH2]
MTQSHTYDVKSVGETLDGITQALERVLAGISALRTQLRSEKPLDMSFDPKDPANKYEVGGLEKLTSRGIEICYRLFDAGKTRYAVAELMDISFGAANHRFKAWEKVGGANRTKNPIS